MGAIHNCIFAANNTKKPCRESRISSHQYKYRLNSLCSAAAPAGFLIKTIIDIKQIKVRNYSLYYSFLPNVSWSYHGSHINVHVKPFNNSWGNVSLNSKFMAIYHCLIMPFHVTHWLSSAQMNMHLATSELSYPFCCCCCMLGSLSRAEWHSATISPVRASQSCSGGLMNIVRAAN